jgi:hypothetical protein
MRIFAVLFITISALASGCSMSSPPPPRPMVIKFQKPKPLEAVPKLVGIVSMVNTDGQFVLVESNQSATLDSGTALKCFRDGVETGVVAVSAERRRPYVTADVVTGEPQRGDQVFE